MKKLNAERGGTCVVTFVAAAAWCWLAAGCSNDQAPKAWSSLSTCLAGEAATAALPVRIKHLRLIQLNNPATPDSKDAWPGSCMKYANDLYGSLDTSGKPGMLRRKLEEKLFCAEGKSSCKLANDETLIPATTSIWETAKDTELPAAIAAGVTKPTAGTEPPINLQSWKALSEKPKRTDGPWLLPDGRAFLLIKDQEGKGRPLGCEIAKGFAKITCKATNADVPELPQQTVQLVAETSGVFAAGLLENGMMAYNLETGKSFGVHGGTGRLLVNGLAVEDEVVPEVKEPPKPAKRGKGHAPEPTMAAPGTIAVLVNNGKAGPSLKLPTKAPAIKPISLHGYAVWVEGALDSTRLVMKNIVGGRLHDAGDFKATLKGSFHTCEGDGVVGLAVWDRKVGSKAKAAEAQGKTALTVTQLHDGTWSKPVEATLPSDRVAESELHCTKDGISVAWASRVDNALEITRLDCTPDSCKSSTAKLPGIESKWWWLLSPLGENIIVVWRSSLGDTRLRIAPIASLATAADKIMFDTSDYGGPTNTDAVSIVSNEAALLLFRDELPVAVRIGRDRSFGVLTP
jgi:hypothetical protein